MNKNNLDLGTLRNSVIKNQQINDVVMPEYSKGGANYFVRIMRCAFESDNVSNHLEAWVDL